MSQGTEMCTLNYAFDELFSPLIECWFYEECEPYQSMFNPIRTTCRLVKMSIQVLLNQSEKVLEKNSLICKFLMLCYQSFIMISLTNEYHDINQSYMVLEGQ